MKITHVIWSLTVGGAESMLVDIVNEQSKNQSVQLIIVNDIIEGNMARKISDRVRISYIQRPYGSRNPFYIFLFNFVLMKFNPDIIHMHKSDLIKIYFPKAVFRAKIFLTVHSLQPFSHLLKKFDHIIAISNPVKENIEKNSATKAQVIYNGIDTNQIKAKSDFTYTNFKIVQLGRLYKNKGHHILLKALAIMVKDFGINNISVDFIGNGTAKKRLTELTTQLNITNFCSFLGQKDRKYVYSNLKNYHLLVQPSITEGFGLTVAEAMAAKVPVLVSNIEGPMEIIKQGEFGYSFNSGDSGDCARKIFEILRTYGSKNFIETLEKGKEYVVSHFHIAQTAGNYVEAYKNSLL